MAQQQPTPVRSICLICYRDFLDPTGGLMPTCGHPNCIREARSQGKPFITPRPTSTEIPKKLRKGTKGKATKFRS